MGYRTVQNMTANLGNTRSPRGEKGKRTSKRTALQADIPDGGKGKRRQVADVTQEQWKEENDAAMGGEFTDDFLVEIHAFTQREFIVAFRDPGEGMGVDEDLKIILANAHDVYRTRIPKAALLSNDCKIFLFIRYSLPSR